MPKQLNELRASIVGSCIKAKWAAESINDDVDAMYGLAVQTIDTLNEREAELEYKVKDLLSDLADKEQVIRRLKGEQGEGVQPLSTVREPLQ